MFPSIPEVVIRTNSAKTELVVNAEHDTVKHFDKVGTVHVIAVDKENCYEENGKAAFTQIDSGKYKTTETADVELLFVSDADAVTVEAIPGTVDHAHAISSADANSLNEKTTGVTFDYDGNNGQTGEGVQDHSTEGKKLNLTDNFNSNKENDKVREVILNTHILYVDGIGTKEGYYRTFAEAYALANDNDIIHFTEGTFVEAIAVRKKPINIEGEGIDKTFIVGPETYSTSTIPMLEWSGWSDDKYVYSLVSINADATIRNLSVMGDTGKVGPTNSNPLVDTPSNAFAGIHVQDANAVIENVNISNIMPTKVNGNSHHGFGLYITTTNSNNYNLTYKGGVVEKTCRGGLYCWTDKYTLNFEDIKVYGNGNKDNPSGRIQLATDANDSTYAYCGFFNSNATYSASSNVTYKNVEFIDVCNVGGWGGAIWEFGNYHSDEGVKRTNCH